MLPIIAGSHTNDWNLCPNPGPAATFSFQLPPGNVLKITFLAQNYQYNDNNVIFLKRLIAAKLSYIFDIISFLFIFQAIFLLACLLIGV